MNKAGRLGFGICRLYNFYMKNLIINQIALTENIRMKSFRIILLENIWIPS